MSSELMPPKDWIVSDAQSYCTKIADGTHDSPKQSATGNLLVTSKNIIDGELDLSKSYFISEEDYSKINRRSKVDKNDVLLSMIGTVGQACVVEQEPNFAIKNVGLLKNDDPIKAKWLYFYLSSPKAQQLIKERLKGTTQQYLSLGEIRKLPVFYPESHDVMKRVVCFLDSLRKKIIINNSVSRTLEQMAQALFKSWFVNFEPVKAKMAALEAGGSQENATLAAMTAISGKDADALAVFEREHPEQYAELKATAELFPSAMQESELGAIPEGWLVKPLGDSLEIKRGGSPRPIKDFIRPTGYPWVKIADATASISPFLFKTSEFIKEEGLKKTVYLRKGDLILSNSATPGLPKFLQLDACIHDGWLYFPKISNYTDTYLYFLFLKIRRELVAKGNGSVFTNLKTDILREHLAVLPECKIVNRFSVLALSYLDAIKANEITINSLSCIRDTLLPKLLSGEITLPEAEQAVSETENV
ncbi:restriction endonuclease subunit S [Citrobacter portucalensis]|uniref:restriction endonuclease subunit S n=1 Tax=Citrobacter portucalensis TaxID=1639133 RepID=UPI0013EE9BE0